MILNVNEDMYKLLYNGVKFSNFKQIEITEEEVVKKLKSYNFDPSKKPIAFKFKHIYTQDELGRPETKTDIAILLRIENDSIVYNRDIGE